MDLMISGLQFDIAWEKKDQNIYKIGELLESIPDGTDIVVLPEMFTTGFSMNASMLAETMDGNTIQWMKSTAKKKKTVITGSLIIVENRNFRNRLVWVTPEGEISHYDKRHSFGLAGETRYYKNGDEPKIFSYKNWKIFTSICYDLRFPVWMKNRYDYHLILNVANWPDTRSAHWNSFLTARAIENQSYLIAVNRTGTDAEGRNYSGDSSIVDYDGNILTKSANIESVINAKLSMEKLMEYRNRFPFLKDQDKYIITD
jgi:predicted amidohydrolase